MSQPARYLLPLLRCTLNASATLRGVKLYFPQLFLSPTAALRVKRKVVPPSSFPISIKPKPKPKKNSI